MLFQLSAPYTAVHVYEFLWWLSKCLSLPGDFHCREGRTIRVAPFYGPSSPPTTWRLVGAQQRSDEWMNELRTVLVTRHRVYFFEASREECPGVLLLQTTLLLWNSRFVLSAWTLSAESPFTVSFSCWQLENIEINPGWPWADVQDFTAYTLCPGHLPAYNLCPVPYFPLSLFFFTILLFTRMHILCDLYSYLQYIWQQVRL